MYKTIPKAICLTRTLNNTFDWLENTGDVLF